SVSIQNVRSKMFEALSHKRFTTGDSTRQSDDKRCFFQDGLSTFSIFKTR
ncbi:MAG: hypothetical protein ACI814_004988, partial [Mariniblastus sp.]